jgi:hypothetical protein
MMSWSVGLLGLLCVAMMAAMCVPMIVGMLRRRRGPRHADTATAPPADDETGPVRGDD